MQLIFLDITKIFVINYFFQLVKYLFVKRIDYISYLKNVKLRFYQEEFQKMSRLSVHIIILVYVFNTFYSLLLCVKVDKIQMKCSCSPL